MPPINQQRSTTGLIVALVVFVILFVTSSIFAMNFYNQFKQERLNAEEYKKNYNALIPESALGSQTINDLKAAKTDQKYGITSGDSILDVATKLRDAEGAVVVGTVGTNTPDQIVNAAKDTLKAAQASCDADHLGVDLEPNSPNLTKAIKTLTDVAKSESGRIAELQKKYDDEAEAHKTDLANTATAAKSFADSQAADAAKAAEALQQVNASLEANKAVVQKTADDSATAAKQLADAVAKQAADEAAFKKQLDSDSLLINSLKDRLGKRRMNPSNNIVTQVDGKIIRAAGKDVCYINLGQGQQISPGLTFEVYSRADGVPAIPTNASGDEQLPVGKASIEVTSVGEISSECRVVHLEPGAVLTEGDVIANLVYDPNVKFKFFVYGNFDMGRSGRPNAADADVIRRLITQWGGELTDKIDVDTDFVVLGSEPQLPSYTKDELQDPLNVDHLAKAQAELDKYSNLRQTAIEYHIPIMNQNRFLYYVGFYDQAKR